MAKIKSKGLVISMIINAAVTLALFCAGCGKMHREEISYFSVGNCGARAVNCECGHYIGILNAAGEGRYMLYTACDLCGELHVMDISRRLFSRGRIVRLSLSCAATEIGLAGDREAVDEELSSRSSEMADYLKETLADGESRTPQVMLEIINRLDDLARMGSIGCGVCGGSNIGMAVEETHVLLYCRNCGSIHYFNAADEEDAQMVRHMRYIDLTDGGKRQSR